MSTVHDEVNEALREAWGVADDAAFPPPMHTALAVAWTAYEPKRHLHAECRLPDAWAGANGIESGCVGAAFETTGNALATLLARKRCVLLNLECTALRQLRSGAEPITIETQIRATRKSIVFIEGVVRDYEKQTLMHASATFAALKGERHGGDDS